MKLIVKAEILMYLLAVCVIVYSLVVDPDNPRSKSHPMVCNNHGVCVK